jgi:hypothetical protein
MPDEEIVNSAPLTLSDGTVVYKGQIYNFDELLDLWEQEAYARQDVG